MCKKHPDVIKHGRKVDMSDLENERALQIQKKFVAKFVVIINTIPINISFVCRFYAPAAFILTFVIPVAIHYYLGEDPFRALNWNVFRYTFGLHMVWLVNSGAHSWGMRPYDK